MRDMSKETCLLSTDSSDSAQPERLTAPTYSFVSECFYMAHKTFDLGYRVCIDKLVKLNQVFVICFHSCDKLVNFLNSFYLTICPRILTF